MAKTQIADIVVPEIFAPYVVELTATKSALFTSGIISDLRENVNMPMLSQTGGQLVNMPYWDDLTGADEVLSDSAALTPAKMTADQDQAVLLTRGKAFSANDLAVDMAGSDPLEQLANRVAAYWARMIQTAVIQSLEGVFGAASMSGNLHDISGAAGALSNITGSTFVDAVQKLGDAKDLLTGVIMHSATEAQLAKNDMIVYERDSGGAVQLRFFAGLPVIVDDELPQDGTDYTTYIFGRGAIGYSEVIPKNPVETERDALAGDDTLVTRRHYISHPRGVAYTGAGMRPSNATLAIGTNWTRKYENKNIRIVKFVHTLDAA